MLHNTRRKMSPTLSCYLSQRRSIRVTITKNSMVWSRDHSRSLSVEDFGHVLHPPQLVRGKHSFQRIIIMTLWVQTSLDLSPSQGISEIPSYPNKEEVLLTKRQGILWDLPLKIGHKVLYLVFSSRDLRLQKSEGWFMTTQTSSLKISKRIMLMSLRRIRILSPIDS